jgi:hypothetical protein
MKKPGPSRAVRAAPTFLEKAKRAHRTRTRVPLLTGNPVRLHPGIFPLGIEGLGGAEPPRWEIYSLP